MFNIRVYGLLILNDSILVSDEYRLGTKMTKFPGGGLDYGEGTRDCLKRECMEELGQEIQILDHFYTTDYFQPTWFLPTQQQLLSIYYLIGISMPAGFKISIIPFDFEEMKEGSQSFRWIQLNQLKESDLTLPIDKKVAGMLKEKFSTNCRE